MNTDNKELTAYYQLVEERVIKMMGGFDAAAAYFDEHKQLSDLWDHTAHCYRRNWNYQRTAKKWYQENVKNKKQRRNRYDDRYISKGSSLIEVTGITTYDSKWSKRQEEKKLWKRLPVLA